MKTRIENEYQLVILDKTYEPRILKHDIVFDLNEPTERENEFPYLYEGMPQIASLKRMFKPDKL
jgi:hypothetical protein